MGDSLRMRVVEAMAANDHPDLLRVAEAHLDRLLDCLAENADEWVRSSSSADLDDAMERGDHKLVDVLLAVLREDR